VDAIVGRARPRYREIILFYSIPPWLAESRESDGHDGLYVDFSPHVVDFDRASFIEE
jgi:hypothetical protein